MTQAEPISTTALVPHSGAELAGRTRSRGKLRARSVEPRCAKKSD